MKKVFFIIAIFITAFSQKTFAQDSTTQKQSQLSQLLTSYYNIKDALVAGNATSASAGANQFVKTASDINYKVISEGSISALLKDARKISESKDIDRQREIFASFSIDMFALAKAVKLTSQPVYEVYCPMKKAYWLSSEKAIKNPYFGSDMLTCGEVAETLQ